jgi:hypothetical protein
LNENQYRSDGDNEITKITFDIPAVMQVIAIHEYEAVEVVKIFFVESVN